MELVMSLQRLKELAYRQNGDYVEFYLILAGGLARSCKRISYRPDEETQWLIINEIDDSYQELSEDELAIETLIVDGIASGALFLSHLN